MKASELAKQIGHWTKEWSDIGTLEVKHGVDEYTIEFTVRTTKTRASSMVTRINLIVAEVAKGASFAVKKELISAPPESREDLATWRIYVSVPIKRPVNRKEPAIA